MYRTNGSRDEHRMLFHDKNNLTLEDVKLFFAYFLGWLCAILVFVFIFWR